MLNRCHSVTWITKNDLAHSSSHALSFIFKGFILSKENKIYCSSIGMLLDRFLLYLAKLSLFVSFTLYHVLKFSLLKVSALKKYSYFLSRAVAYNFKQQLWNVCIFFSSPSFVWGWRLLALLAIQWGLLECKCCWRKNLIFYGLKRPWGVMDLRRNTMPIPNFLLLIIRDILTVVKIFMATSVQTDCQDKVLAYHIVKQMLV